jgi:hypothetical protein
MLTGRERLGVVKESPYSLKRIMISRTKFDEWLNKSKPGDKITYYRGYIMGPHLQKYSPTSDERRVRAIKNYAYKAYEHNVVTLIQKKHDDFDYEYIAVRK